MNKTFDFLNRFNNEKLITLVAIVFIVIFLISTSSKDLLELIVGSKQVVSYAKTEIALTKAAAYVDDNDSLFEKYEDATYCITVKDLRNKGYITGKLTNPNTLTELSDSTIIEIKYHGDQFLFKYNNGCVER